MYLPVNAQTVMRKIRLNISQYRKPLFSLVLLLTVVCLTASIHAQTLAEKLNQRTDFIPRSTAPAEQLIEIAQRFKIPMAIEWLDRANVPTKLSFVFKRGSVLDLIKAVLRQSPDHVLIVHERILYIYAPIYSSHKFNSKLNILLQVGSCYNIRPL